MQLVDNPSEILQDQELFDLSAEEAFLGCILIDSRAAYDVDDKSRPVLSFLREEMFYLPDHQNMWSVLRDMIEHRRAIDVVTLRNELRHAGHFADDENDYGWTDYRIIALINATPTSVNAVYYAQEVERWYLRRLMRLAGQDLVKLAYEPEVDGDRMDRASLLFQHLNNQRPFMGGESMHAIASRYVDSLLDEDRFSRPHGIETGYLDFDKMVAIGEKMFLLFAARPGMGKSSLVLGSLLHMCKRMQKRAVLFNLEMSAEELTDRMVSQVSRVNLTDVTNHRTGRARLDDDKAKLVLEASAGLETMDLTIETGITSLAGIESRCIQLHGQRKLDVVVVDYVQLVTAKGYNREQEVSAVSRGLKNLAGRLGCPVIALAQLSRAVEARQNKRPILSDLRESGSLEQDADVVAFIYRDEYYNPDTSDRPNVAEVIIAKYRNGPTGVVDLYWNAIFAQFRNLQRQNVELPKLF